MNKLMDKLMLFLLCSLSLLFTPISEGIIGAFLLAIVVSALNSFFDQKKLVLLSLTYCFVAIFLIDFVVFLPLMLYDLLFSKNKWFGFAVLLPVLLMIHAGDFKIFYMLLLFCCISFLLQNRTQALIHSNHRYYDMQDNYKEQEIHLERKNKELMEKQDYEIRLATLSERNRIAREIHDNVGHLLTRCILQVGAMQVMHQNNEQLKAELNQEKETLTNAMDSIRKSVHDLHEDSVDLKLQLQTLLNEFCFCPITLHYQAGVLPRKIQYCFLAVTKEALSNIAKHSNATQAYISVIEHPALYQLIIKDNGVVKTATDGKGIGILNMRERVESLHGFFHIDNKHGFHIFISVPKDKNSNNNEIRKEYDNEYNYY